MAIALPKFPRRRPSAGVAGKAQPAVSVALGSENGIYEAGGRLTATWRISRVTLDRLEAVEVSVMWHTEGKGDEDLQVVHFERLDENHIRRLGLADQQSLQCDLPVTPLSYHGRLLSVCWCIRLRLFLSDGCEVVTEHPFHLVSPGANHKEVVAEKVDADAEPAAHTETLLF